MGVGNRACPRRKGGRPADDDSLCPFGPCHCPAEEVLCKGNVANDQGVIRFVAGRKGGRRRKPIPLLPVGETGTCHGRIEARLPAAGGHRRRAADPAVGDDPDTDAPHLCNGGLADDGLPELEGERPAGFKVDLHLIRLCSAGPEDVIDE